MFHEGRRFVKRPTSRILSFLVVAFVVAIGGAAAVAAVKGGDLGSEQKAVLDDAAGQLGVKPSELENALRTAQKNQIDEAVKDGRLSKEEGDKLKALIDSGKAPLLGPPLGRGEFGGPGFHGPGFRHFGPGFGPDGPRMHGPGHHFGFLGSAAAYLGLTGEGLRTQLALGKSLADIAKATDGKTVQGLEDAIVAGAKKDLDALVKDGAIPQEHADEMLKRLREHVGDLVQHSFSMHWDDDERGTDSGGSAAPSSL